MTSPQRSGTRGPGLRGGRSARSRGFAGPSCAPSFAPSSSSVDARRDQSPRPRNLTRSSRRLGRDCRRWWGRTRDGSRRPSFVVWYHSFNTDTTLYSVFTQNPYPPYNIVLLREVRKCEVASVRSRGIVHATKSPGSRREGWVLRRRPRRGRDDNPEIHPEQETRSMRPPFLPPCRATPAAQRGHRPQVPRSLCRRRDRDVSGDGGRSVDV